MDIVIEGRGGGGAVRGKEKGCVSNKGLTFLLFTSVVMVTRYNIAR